MLSRWFRTRGTRPRTFASASARASEDVAVMNIQTDKTSLAGATAADIKRILQMIPHRYPIPMVDRVVAMQLDHTATGINNVSINDQSFHVQFSAAPTIPAVPI